MPQLIFTWDTLEVHGGGGLCDVAIRIFLWALDLKFQIQIQKHWVIKDSPFLGEALDLNDLPYLLLKIPLQFPFEERCFGSMPQASTFALKMLF